ncbi:MAG: hypothetical protein F6K00_04680 [Leptolyngbya sp. SIOISBB]|nr:hypothetical protein [Leptolyngbya sp. SIOISBB]
MADTNRKSLYKIIGLPNDFGVILLTFGLILLLSPYLSGFDFGIFQIPKLDPKMQQNLRILGPIIFAGLIFLFVPIWKESKSNKETSHKSLQYRSALGRHVDWKIDLGSEISSQNEMIEGSYLKSINSSYKFVVQGDGNIVLYENSKGNGNIVSYENARAIWASNTDGKGIPPFRLILMEDGNLLLLDANEQVTWASNTSKKGKSPHTLKLQNDRNLVIYDSLGQAMWASNTNTFNT